WSFGTRLRSALLNVSDSLELFNARLDRATASSTSFHERWKAMPHGFRQFAFYTGLFAALGQSIAVLGAASGAGLTVLGGALTSAAIGAGALFMAFKGLTGDLADLPAAVRPAAAAFQSIGGAFNRMQDAVQAAALRDLAPVFARLRVLVDSLTPSMVLVGDAVGR